MDIVEFLTSKEIIVVYIVAAVACLLCFIIYLVEKHNDRGRKRHNTRELNKLVEQVKEEIEIIPEEEIIEPVLQVTEEVQEDNSFKDDDIRNLIEEISTEVQQEIKTLEDQEVEVLTPEDDFQYTTIEPDANVAKEELYKITEELRTQEEKVEEVVQNSRLTDYEVEQEQTAIISLEELVKKSKEMYEANELTQYKDEGNEPISINDLEILAGREAEPITSPFEISTVVGDDENEKVESVKQEEVKKFISSPIISPVYGIEKQENINELELENTANYDKLDAEIKKTNEFLMTLKELQNKLD